MKKFISITLMLVTSYFSFAQNVGIGTTTPNSSAQLDISSTTKGVLVPRMTSLQRLSIVSPVKGLLVFDTDNNGFYFYNGSSWSSISGNAEFISQNNMVHNTSNTTNDNFVFGSVKMDDTTGTADNNRFFFNKSKGAFRAGHVTANNWNNDSTGVYSFAAGTDTKANGEYATAMGEGSVASGHSAVAMGGISSATGWVSTAMGGETKATASYTTALGYRSTAVADYATAMGNTSIASGNSSTAMGLSTTASGSNATAMGAFNTASGNGALAAGLFSTASGYTSTAIGIGNTASGNYTTALGVGVKTLSFGETGVGLYNSAYTPGANGTTVFNNTDRLFSIGNGTADNARSNALTIFKNGNVGIGTDNPAAKLDVNGQVIIEQKNFGGYGGLLIKGDAPGSNYPNIGFSIKNKLGNDVIGGLINGEIVSNNNFFETMDISILTSQSGLSGLTERFRVKGNGALAISGSTGAYGQVLTSNGAFSPPVWKNAPYVFSIEQNNVLFINGSLLEAAIPGVDGAQFTLTQQAKVLFSYQLTASNNVLGATTMLSTADIYDASSQRVGHLFVSADIINFNGPYLVQKLITLPAGTYTILASAKRLNTLSGDLTLFYGAGEGMVFQVYPE